MRSIMTLAYKMEYIDEDVGISRRIEFPKADTPEVEAFNAEEASQILKAAESEPINIKLLVKTSLFTGLRRGEIVGLKWEDIDLEKQTLSVRRSIYKHKANKAKEKSLKSSGMFDNPTLAYENGDEIGIFIDMSGGLSNMSILFAINIR